MQLLSPTGFSGDSMASMIRRGVDEEESLVMQPQTHALIRYLGDVFLAFVAIMFVAGLGSILALTLSATGPRILLPLFLGPTYFVLHSGWCGGGVPRQSPSMFQGCAMDVGSARDLVCIRGCP